MNIKTSEIENIQPFLRKLYQPPVQSHKGMNGKVLVIGGSTLFHSASLWAAEIASHFVDMVHYSSTVENNAIFHELKSVFRNGIVVEHKDIESYVAEDDAVLIGPGMVRDELKNEQIPVTSFNDILTISNEAKFTRELTRYLLHTFPDKKFVIDAGALQMMDPEWLQELRKPAIITPHQLEFERLFDVSIHEMSIEEKQKTVESYAKEYHCIILLKAVVDIISDGTETFVIEGGNAGLTKGGSGDILAGLCVTLYAKNDPLLSAVLASFLEKKAAEALSFESGTRFNMTELIKQIPRTLHSLETVKSK